MLLIDLHKRLQRHPQRLRRRVYGPLKTALQDQSFHATPPPLAVTDADAARNTELEVSQAKARTDLKNTASASTGAATQRMQYLTAAKAILDSKGAPVTGAAGKLVAQLSAPFGGVDATNYQKVAKELGNAAIQAGKGNFGSGMTENDVTLQTHQLSPSVDMTWPHHARCQLTARYTENSQYVIDSGKRTSACAPIPEMTLHDSLNGMTSTLIAVGRLTRHRRSEAFGAVPPGNGGGHQGLSLPGRRSQAAEQLGEESAACLLTRKIIKRNPPRPRAAALGRIIKLPRRLRRLIPPKGCLRPTRRWRGPTGIPWSTGHGVYQLGAAIGHAAGLVSDEKMAQIQAGVDETKRQDAPLMATTAGKVGNIAGTGALAVPLTMIPGGDSLLGAGAAGGALGAAQPVATGESRTANAALGAAGGAGGAAVGKVAGAVLGGLGKGAAADARQAAVDTLKNEGIPLTVGQQTGAKLPQTIERASSMTSDAASDFSAQQAQAVNKAVLRRIGVDDPNVTAATPDVLQGRPRPAITGVMDDVASQDPHHCRHGCRC